MAYHESVSKILPCEMSFTGPVGHMVPVVFVASTCSLVLKPDLDRTRILRFFVQQPPSANPFSFFLTRREAILNLSHSCVVRRPCPLLLWIV